MRKITITAKNAKNFFAKTKGLLGAMKPMTIFFQTRWGIHTYGLRFPIDIVILDDTFRVKIRKQNLTPNSFFVWNPRYQNVLELPEGTIKRKKILIGTMVNITLH